MIEIKNLTKIFGNVEAVKNLSLKIDRGEIFGFIGPNGAGVLSAKHFACAVLGTGL